MFTLLDFQNFSLTEKLNLELAKYYTRLWKDAGGDKRYRKMFGGKNRIYIPLEGQTTIDYFSDIIDDIERALADLGYEPLSIEGNWAKQIKGRREKKITKVLSSDKEKRYLDLNRKYLKILDLHKKAQEDLYEIVISKHGYDIASMSADRGWDSCMNVLKDKDNKYVEVDIKEGSIIAYLIKKNDRNIQNARARLLIKPFISDDGEEIVLFPNTLVYGTDLDGFRETVEKWLEKNQTMSKFRYRLLKDLYPEGLRYICNLNFIKIEDLLNSIVEGKWKINDDNTIDVKGNVDLVGVVKLSKNTIKEILFDEYSFRIVKGNFHCSENRFEILKGSPQKVSGKFDCSYNYLKTLKGRPEEVKGDFICSHNQLTNLEGLPLKLGNGLICHNNQLTSLEGVPLKIDGDFSCSQNQLKTIDESPRRIGKDFDCSYNSLTTLKGGPREVKGNFMCDSNQLTNLEGAPLKINGYFDCSENQLKTLKGAPESVGDDFICNYNKLNTLKGFPKIIGSDLIIDEDFPFTDEEIREVCKIKGKIIR